MHPAELDEATLRTQCRVVRTRASGPGGQHRNKVETAVVVTHVPTGLVGEATERRSQELNRKHAFFRLRLRLAVEVRTERDPAAPPSARWLGRVRGGRLVVAAEHDDLPALLAEALDRLALAAWDAPATAAALGVSTTQLVRLLALHGPALGALNAVRAARGERPLRE